MSTSKWHAAAAVPARTCRSPACPEDSPGFRESPSTVVVADRIVWSGSSPFERAPILSVSNSLYQMPNGHTPLLCASIDTNDLASRALHKSRTDAISSANMQHSTVPRATCVLPPRVARSQPPVTRIRGTDKGQIYCCDSPRPYDVSRRRVVSPSDVYVVLSRRYLLAAMSSRYQLVENRGLSNYVSIAPPCLPLR